MVNSHNRNPKGTVRVRIEAIRSAKSTVIKDGTLYLDRAHFRRWLSAAGGDFAGLVEKLEADNAIPTVRRLSLTRGTDIRLPQVYVLGIRMTHPRLDGLLDRLNDAQVSNVVNLSTSRGSP
jgi:hypothetical protein